MRNGLLGAIGLLLASAGLALAQPVLPPASPQPPPFTPPSPTPLGPVPLTPAPGLGTPGLVPVPYPASPIPTAPGAMPQDPSKGLGLSAVDGNAFIPPPPNHNNAFKPEPPPVDPYCCNDRFWFIADYLVWILKYNSLPPLLTGGNATNQGVLGRPGTQTIIGGDNNIPAIVQPGGRFVFGYWCDETQDLGFEIACFYLPQQTLGALVTGTQAVTSDVSNIPGLNRSFSVDINAGNSVIARPFFDVATNRESSLLVTAPGQFNGQIYFGSTTRFYGVEGNALTTELCGVYTPDLILGFRYLDLDERLDIFQTSGVLPGGVAGFNGVTTVRAPNLIQVFDVFRTHNQFYGGQIGTRCFYQTGALEMSLVGKVAMGVNHETIEIRGATTQLGANGQRVATAPGGLLAVRSNSGVAVNDVFAIVPEIGLNLGLQISPRIHFTLGYTFLYWWQATRPSNEIDRAVDARQVPASFQFRAGANAVRPPVTRDQSDFWAQGLSLGLLFRF